VTWHLKAEIGKSEKTAIARQRLVRKRFRYNSKLKHVLSVMLTKEFPWIQTSSLYKEPWGLLIDSVEENSEGSWSVEDIFHEGVRTNCSYDFWIPNKLIRQSKPRLRVTNTCDNIHQVFIIPIYIYINITWNPFFRKPETSS
jgi:hypothetical protein